MRGLMLIELISWLGGLFYAIFSVPQAVAVAREGNADSISLYFLILMWFGSLLSLLYVWPTKEAPLMANFILNLITSSVMLKYKLFARK